MSTSAVTCGQETGNRLRRREGSSLVAALALAYIVFLVTVLSLERVASSASIINLRHDQTNALLLAEAGIQKAAHRLSSNSGYTGEQGTRMPTGWFEVRVSGSGPTFQVTAIGYADSPFRKKVKQAIRAEVAVSGRGAFRISNWRENP